ncbi:MAG: molybdopterin dinucleotide binding domain-containing protein [Gemmatimonadaceae bacterium]
MLRRMAPASIRNLRTREGDLRVARYIATRRGDPDRGPKIWMRASDAMLRLVEDGELVWVFGPRRHELAELQIDDSIAEGDVVVRDVAGLSISEYVRVSKPDLDTRPNGSRA